MEGRNTMRYINTSEHDVDEMTPEEVEDNSLSETELEELYDEWLDEVYGDVPVAGLEFSTSRLLKEADPIAHRVGFLDWLDSYWTEVIESD